jgi:magnesium transporter
MTTELLPASPNSFCWIDLHDPSKYELDTVATRFGLHATALEDCLDPNHLPKVEQSENGYFLIARLIDKNHPSDATTVRALTNKLALFWGKGYLLTIHKFQEQRVLSIKSSLTNGVHTIDSPMKVVYAFLKSSLKTYEEEVAVLFEEMDAFEDKLFLGKENADLLYDMYVLKRKGTVYLRLAYMMHEVCEGVKPDVAMQTTYWQDVRESAKSVLLITEQLNDNINGLLNLHISLASLRTNHVMRVLTLFSVFFLPLTFIVGVYGMNFHVMPELSWPMGYAGVWVAMVLITILIYLWFRNKKWM